MTHLSQCFMCTGLFTGWFDNNYESGKTLPEHRIFSVAKLTVRNQNEVKGSQVKTTVASTGRFSFARCVCLCVFLDTLAHNCNHSPSADHQLNILFGSHVASGHFANFVFFFISLIHILFYYLYNLQSI